MKTFGDIDLSGLVQRFHEHYGRHPEQDPPQCYFAPGRVNLIGDHTDYTGGLVFPCGIDRGTVLLIRRTQNGRYRFASTGFDATAELAQHELGQPRGDHWIDYPLGVIDQFSQRGVTADGFDCFYSGNIPHGAGLSSSASIEVVTAMALNELYAVGLPAVELAKIAMRAENDFVGMHCGIMDQFAVAMAKSGHAMLLNCSTLDYRQVPLALGDYRIVIANTNDRRELNESAYNTRVIECQRALERLQARLPIQALAELTPDELDLHLDLFEDDPVALQRAAHVASENNRVRAAVAALERHDLAAFGELMTASHRSLRDAFEVSSAAVDEMVRLALAEPGVLGSRMTGGGFGGCTVSLVPEASSRQFEENVGARYLAATGLQAGFYPVMPGAGVHRLALS